MSSNNHQENEILSYIEKHGIEHKDVTPQKKKHKKKTHFEKKGKRIRRVLDLHGRRRDEVAPIIREVFHECKSRGVDTILIIHGVGYGSNKVEGPIVKKLVRAMLENELSNYIKDYRTAIPGGSYYCKIVLRCFIIQLFSCFVRLMCFYFIVFKSKIKNLQSKIFITPASNSLCQLIPADRRYRLSQRGTASSLHCHIRVYRECVFCFYTL